MFARVIPKQNDDHRGMIHWDTDMTRFPDIPFHVQGVLALTDTEPDMGGFQCIPETYQHLDEFLATQTPEKIASRNPDYTGYSITRPRLAAGDLLVWTSGAPAGQVLDTFVYFSGILGGNWGLSAAVGLCKGIVGTILVISANKAAHMLGEQGVF